jgi:hypothetical protein
MDMLSKASQSASVALAIVLFALPLSTCLAQAAEMSMEQRECCEKMAGSCDASMMPSSHSCCERPVSDQAVTASRIKSNDFSWTVVTRVEAISPLLRPVLGIGASNFESPPESPPQVSSVLRI